MKPQFSVRTLAACIGAVCVCLAVGIKVAQRASVERLVREVVDGQDYVASSCAGCFLLEYPVVNARVTTVERFHGADAACRRLMDLLDDANIRRKYRAIHALGELGPTAQRTRSEVIRYLQQAAADADPEISGEAVLALSKYRAS
jgi:hypothetical protein